MNQITRNVEMLLSKHDFIDNDTKLVMMYLREFEQLRFDSRYISVKDFLNIDMKLIQQIIDARYLLSLLEEEE